MLENLGVIIPTYNRHNYLSRQLDWLRQIGIQEIVIMDASTLPYSKSTAGIKYYHMPGITIGNRVKFASGQLESPIAVVLGDDDYLAPTGCSRSIEILMTDPSVASAQARYVAAFQSADDCKFVGTYLSAAGLRVESPDNNERLKHWMTHYMHSVYAPRRTDRLRAIVQSFPENEKNYNVMELAYVIADAWLGKHINISDSLYMVRSDIPGSGGKTIESLPTYIKKNKVEYDSWVNQFCRNFSQRTGSNFSDFLKFWQDGIYFYEHVFLANRQKSLSVPARLKNMIPKTIKQYVKKQLHIADKIPSTPVDKWILDTQDFKDIKSHIERFPLS